MEQSDDEEPEQTVKEELGNKHTSLQILQGCLNKTLRCHSFLNRGTIPHSEYLSGTEKHSKAGLRETTGMTLHVEKWLTLPGTAVVQPNSLGHSIFGNFIIF
ncbi:hypothetical protein J6590_063807 [Homalodisca vitripennis]|nr:hypothetical protein J6590_063807 [Homalodisca vitripennis]